MGREASVGSQGWQLKSQLGKASAACSQSSITCRCCDLHLNSGSVLGAAPRAAEIMLGWKWTKPACGTGLLTKEHLSWVKKINGVNKQLTSLRIAPLPPSTTLMISASLWGSHMAQQMLGLLRYDSSNSPFSWKWPWLSGRIMAMVCTCTCALWSGRRVKEKGWVVRLVGVEVCFGTCVSAKSESVQLH